MVLLKTQKRSGSIRTVIDTNVVFAGLYSNQGTSFQVLRALSRGHISPVLSVALVFEYEDVLKRDSIKLGLKLSDIDLFLDNICKCGIFHKIHYLWRPWLSDPKDDHILELAVASGVNTITTFNAKDFKGVEKFGVRIVNPRQMLEEIKWVQ
jgi:putative PIN family toxin of toxin-antitoxin system